MQRAEVVDLHLVAEDGLVELLEVPGMGGVGGRGHQDVARTEALGEAVDGRLQLGAVAHVGARDPDHPRRPFGRLRGARPRAGDGACGLVETALVAGDERHPGTPFREDPRGGEPDAARSPGHDGVLAHQLGHDPIVPRSRRLVPSQGCRVEQSC